MKKTLLAISLTLFAGVFALAQSDDYKKGEVFLGYSNGQVDMGRDSDDSVRGFFRDRENFNGFNVAGVYNVSRYVGIRGDISGTYKRESFSDTFAFGPGTPTTISGDADFSLYNFLGGVQVKDNSSESRFKPFAHGLVGAGHARAEINNVRCSPAANCLAEGFGDESFSETGLAFAFGGGVDVKLSDRFDLRLVQADYNPIRIDGQFTHNFRIGIGIVIK